VRAPSTHPKWNAASPERNGFSATGFSWSHVATCHLLGPGALVRAHAGPDLLEAPHDLRREARGSSARSGSAASARSKLRVAASSCPTARQAVPEIRCLRRRAVEPLRPPLREGDPRRRRPRIRPQGERLRRAAPRGEDDRGGQEVPVSRRHRRRDRERAPSEGLGGSAYERLGPRELEVLQLLAEGLTSSQIGERLCIATATVETHRRNLMRKLHLHGVAELTKYAVRGGVSPLDTRMRRQDS